MSSRAVQPSSAWTYFAVWPCSRSARTRRGELLVVRDERACIAGRAEVLARIEAECCSGPAGPGAHAVALGAVGLAGVLDERSAAASSPVPRNAVMSAIWP